MCGIKASLVISLEMFMTLMSCMIDEPRAIPTLHMPMWCQSLFAIAQWLNPLRRSRSHLPNPLHTSVERIYLRASSLSLRYHQMSSKGTVGLCNYPNGVKKVLNLLIISIHAWHLETQAILTGCLLPLHGRYAGKFPFSLNSSILSLYLSKSIVSRPCCLADLAL